MRAKKADASTAEPRIDNTGIPVVRFDALLMGSCPVCYQPAQVSVHKHNGYYLRCMSCSLNLFTRSPAGSVTFRAQQEVLADPELRATLSDMTASLYSRFLDEMINLPES